MKVAIVAGARPNFVKVAPLLRAIGALGDNRVEPLLVDTGQHYDDAMAAAFFGDLQLPRPRHSLRAGSGSHALQTATVMERFEPILLEERPDLVVVVGDVNSTLACALVAAKVGVPVAHIEAGLRSFDRTMPEEINRIVTDTLSDLLFTTEQSANDNLKREGIAADKIFFVGNVMIDSLRWAEPLVQRSSILDRLGVDHGEYLLVTLHRPANVDDPRRLTGIVEMLNELSGEVPVLFPAHPRTLARLSTLAGHARLEPVALADGKARARRGAVTLIGALPYIDFLRLSSAARLVLTDSGGVQEETTCLGVACLSLRDNTERPITTEVGTAVLAGTDPSRVLPMARAALNGGRKAPCMPPLWDGHAAERIVRVLLQHH